MTCYYGVVCILLFSYLVSRGKPTSVILMGYKGRFQNTFLKWCCDMLPWCGFHFAIFKKTQISYLVCGSMPTTNTLVGNNSTHVMDFFGDTLEKECSNTKGS